MFSYLFAFVKVVATTVDSVTKAVLFNVSGPVSTDDSGADEACETARNQEGFTGLGLVARPRPPSTMKDGSPVHNEAIGVRTGDGLVPFTYRDLRLNLVYSAPKDGSIALVGYGGGFHSIEDTVANSGDQKASTHVIYAPYEFSDGTPAKAHVVTLDTTPGNESVTVVHGSGMAITMMAGGKNSVVIKNKAGDAYVEINDDGITINGNAVINGGATIGSPVGALPAAIATKLALYLTQLESDIAAGFTAIGGGFGAAAAAAFAANATTRGTLAGAIPATKTSIA